MAANPIDPAVMKAGSPGGPGSFSQTMGNIGRASMAANGRQWSKADDDAASARYQQMAASPQGQAITQAQGQQAINSARFAQNSPPSATVSHVHSFGGKGGGQ